MIPDYLNPKNTEVIGVDGEPFLVKVELLSFNEWPAKVKLQIQTQLDTDKAAQVALDMLAITDELQRLKKFAYCRNGGFDKLADYTSCGSHNLEYFDCPLRETCEPKVQKMLCRCFPAPNGVLTPREIEIVKLVCTDMPDKAIADTLGISVDTARNHRRNIEHKTATYSKSGIVRFAYEKGIV